MQMPSKGAKVYIEGYGSPTYIGGDFREETEDEVGLKYEGVGLDEGYGRGIIWIPYEEFDENRIYPEQVPDGESTVKSWEKAKEKLSEREGFGE